MTTAMTTKIINPFILMKALPFDMTNLITEFIGDDDAKTLFKKSVLFNKEFHDVLKIWYNLTELTYLVNNYSAIDNFRLKIKDKMFEDGHSINMSEILFYEEDGLNRISFKQFYNKDNWFEGNYLEIADFECSIYNDDVLKELFYELVDSWDDVLFCYFNSSTIRSYLLRCGIVIPMESILYMMDYNNEDALHILANLIKSNLIDNAPSFEDFMMEEHREEVIDRIFQDDDYTIKFELNGKLIVLKN